MAISNSVSVANIIETDPAKIDFAKCSVSQSRLLFQSNSLSNPDCKKRIATNSEQNNIGKFEAIRLRFITDCGRRAKKENKAQDSDLIITTDH